MVTRSPHKRLLIAAALVLGLVAFAPGTASAQFLDFDLGTPNSAISGFTGPYAHVHVALNSSTSATVTFTSLTAGGNIYLMGGAQAFDLNVNAASFSVGSVTESNAGTGFTPGPTGTIGSGNVNGFGSFNLTIDNFDGFTHSADKASFTLTNTSGTWASAANVLVQNANGALGAAHIFVTSSPADQSNGAIATGLAAGGSGNTVLDTPEPSTMALALSGLVGAGFAGLRRLRRPRAATV